MRDFRPVLIVQVTVSPFLLKLLHSLQRLNELHHFLPLAVQNELPDKRSLYMPWRIRYGRDGARGALLYLRKSMSSE